MIKGNFERTVTLPQRTDRKTKPSALQKQDVYKNPATSKYDPDNVLAFIANCFEQTKHSPLFVKLSVPNDEFETQVRRASKYINDQDRNEYGRTILHLLCMYGTEQFVRTVLDNQGDKLIPDYLGFTPAHFCAVTDNVAVLKYVHSQGAAIDDKSAVSRRTPLHIAAVCNSVDVIRFLLAHKVDVDAQDKGRKTPLWLAMFYKHDAACSLIHKSNFNRFRDTGDKVNFLLRCCIKCPSFAVKLMSHKDFTSYNRFRNVRCVWLNKIPEIQSQGIGKVISEDNLTCGYVNMLNKIDISITSQPFMKKYIHKAWTTYGAWHSGLMIVTHVLFALLFTVYFLLYGMMVLSSDHWGSPVQIIFCVVVVLTGLLYLYLLWMDFYTLYYKIDSHFKSCEHEKKLITEEKSHCHPVMRNAKLLMEEEEKRLHKCESLHHLLKTMATNFTYLAIHVFLFMVIGINISYFVVERSASDDVSVNTSDTSRYLYAINLYSSSLALCLVWISAFITLRIHRVLGPFIMITKLIVEAVLQFLILYLVMFTPVLLIYWKTIFQWAQADGNVGRVDISLMETIAKVFRITLADYDYEEGLAIASSINIPLWWDALLLLWIFLSNIVLLNLIIALMGDRFANYYGKVKHHARQNQFWFIHQMQMMQSTKNRKKFSKHLKKACAPYIYNERKDVATWLEGYEELELDIDEVHGVLKDKLTKKLDQSVCSESYTPRPGLGVTRPSSDTEISETEGRDDFRNAGYSEAYTTPFQYGAQVRDSNAYKVHHYIDQQKLARFEHAYQTAYPRIDIDLKYFKILCEDSDDINLGDINGQSVLHALCLYGSVNAVKIAVDAGGDVHQEDCHGYSVAHYCAIADRVDLLGYVYDGHGVSLSKKCVKSGRTPVHVACICDSLEVVKELVSRGVDYKVLDSNGYSAMWLAMYYHNNDISEYLFQQGGEGANCNVDMVSFLFRALDKCQGLGSKILDSFITECKYRDVTCIWLNKMVDDNSYLKADLTYPYLYVSNISDKFIEHTFIKTFISVGWRKFGRKAAAVEIALSLVYCLLWTLFYMIDDGKSMKGNAFRICVYIVLILYVAFMIFWSIRRLRVKSQANQSLILSETGIILSELSCLHPCMFEASYVLANEKRAILSKKTTVTSLLLLGHQLVDATVHVLSLIILILDFIKIFNKVDSTLYDNMIGEPTLSDRPGAKYRVNERSGPGGSYNIQEVYLIVSAVVLILVWITSFNKIRLLRRFGSFLILIINVGTLLAKFACFYVFLYIPIACVFWKTIYQYSNESSSLNITSLQSFYRVYRMTFSDYSYDDGLEIATSIGMPSWWDILVFYWITVGGLILLNILGGLVFAALTQPLEKSRIIAQKERLWFLCEVVMLQSGKEKAGFARYLDLECNPCVVARSAGGVRDVESEVKQLRTELEAIRDKFSDDNEPSSSSSFKYDPCI